MALFRKASLLSPSLACSLKSSRIFPCIATQPKISTLFSARSFNSQTLNKLPVKSSTAGFVKKDLFTGSKSCFNPHSNAFYCADVLNSRRHKHNQKKIILGFLSFLGAPIHADQLIINEDNSTEHVQVAPSLLDKIYKWFERWFITPIMTLWRFGFLALNFLPVIVTSPICFMGKRQPEFDNELSGAIWWYNILTNRLENGGAAFIKLAQWAASRSDIFPKQLCLALSKLHSAVDPHSLEDTRKIIRLAYNGQEIEDLFLEFEPEPLGVGAIAQVYRARPKPGFKPKVTGGELISDLATEARSRNQANPEYVAIKVLHPRVKKIVERDLKIMMFVAQILNLIPTLSWLSLPDEVVTFGEMMRSQLDLRNEAQNLLQLRKNFEGSFTTKFPRPLVEWVSTQVLVERYEFGIPLKHFLHANTHTPYDISLSAIGLDSFLHMLVFDNFIHADLHPGNIMIKFYRPTTMSFFEKISAWFKDTEFKFDDEVTKKLVNKASNDVSFEEAIQDLYNEGYFPRLIFLDAGLVASLDDVNRRNFLDLFQALAEFNGFEAGRLMVERCRSPGNVVHGDEFASKMEQLVSGIKSKTFKLSNIDISSLLQNVLQMVREHKVRLEGDFINVVISILVLEGIGRSLDPDIDLFKMALPILRSYGAQETKEHSLVGIQSLPGGTSWWIKLWFQLEARQLLSNFMELPDPVETALFGNLKPMLLDI